MPVIAVVMIGVDPHKASHTAVAINAAEEPLGQLRVRASAVQAERLLEWARAWPERAWAVEGAGGLGHLLAQQLLSAGERVLDVPPKLAARRGCISRQARSPAGRLTWSRPWVRLRLRSGRTGKEPAGPASRFHRVRSVMPLDTNGPLWCRRSAGLLLVQILPVGSASAGRRISCRCRRAG